MINPQTSASPDVTAPTFDVVEVRAMRTRLEILADAIDGGQWFEEPADRSHPNGTTRFSRRLPSQPAGRFSEASITWTESWNKGKQTWTGALTIQCAEPLVGTLAVSHHRMPSPLGCDPVRSARDIVRSLIAHSHVMELRCMEEGPGSDPESAREIRRELTVLAHVIRNLTDDDIPEHDMVVSLSLPNEAQEGSISIGRAGHSSRPQANVAVPLAILSEFRPMMLPTLHLETTRRAPGQTRYVIGPVDFDTPIAAIRTDPVELLRLAAEHPWVGRVLGSMRT